MPTFMTTQFSHQLFEIHSLILNLSTTQGPYPFSHSSNWPFSSGSSDYTWKWSVLAVWLQHKLSSHSFHIWGASPRIHQQLHSLDSVWERASKLALPVHLHCLVFLKSWKCVHAILQRTVNLVPTHISSLISWKKLWPDILEPAAPGILLPGNLSQMTQM